MLNNDPLLFVGPLNKNREKISGCAATSAIKTRQRKKLINVDERCGTLNALSRVCLITAVHVRERTSELQALLRFKGANGFTYLGCKLHSFDDVPALARDDGTQMWFRHGREHRDKDLPAVVWGEGGREWYRDGVQHRDGDRPAIVKADEHNNGLSTACAIATTTCQP